MLTDLLFGPQVNFRKIEAETKIVIVRV
jgi:hypothetical protein